MTKTLRMGAAGAAIAFAMTMGTVAHAADDADATAKVEVLKPLTLTNDSDLDFGAVAVNGAGSISLGITAGAADLDCSATDIVCTGTVGLAGFTVSDGSAGRTVTVDLPTATDLVHTSVAVGDTPAANQQIALSDFVTDADENTDVDGNFESYSVQLGAAGDADEGEAVFQVGGTLTFTGDEIAGEYEATFNVSVEYS